MKGKISHEAVIINNLNLNKIKVIKNIDRVNFI